jgi:hypothetical protein
MLKMAYDDAANAIEFCNWYTMNRPALKLHEQQLLDIAYQDGATDAIQDPDHICKPGEYFSDNYAKHNEQQ